MCYQPIYSPYDYSYAEAAFLNFTSKENKKTFVVGMFHYYLWLVCHYLEAVYNP